MRKDVRLSIYWVIAAIFLLFDAPAVKGQAIAVPPDFPLPITSQKYTETARAKVFFKIYPIFSNAYESLNRKEYGKAEKLLQTILEIDPGNNLARYYLIQIYTYTREPGKVLKLADQLTRSVSRLYSGTSFQGLRRRGAERLPGRRPIFQPSP